MKLKRYVTSFYNIGPLFERGLALFSGFNTPSSNKLY
jgi:hypothetical protein